MLTTCAALVAIAVVVASAGLGAFLVYGVAGEGACAFDVSRIRCHCQPSVVYELGGMDVVFRGIALATLDVASHSHLDWSKPPSRVVQQLRFGLWSTDVSCPEIPHPRY